MITFRYYKDPVLEKYFVYYNHSLLRCDDVYNGIQIICWLSSLLILCTAAASIVQLLPGSPHHGQAALFLFQTFTLLGVYSKLWSPWMF